MAIERDHSVPVAGSQTIRSLAIRSPRNVIDANLGVNGFDAVPAGAELLVGKLSTVEVADLGDLLVGIERRYG